MDLRSRKRNSHTPISHQLLLSSTTTDWHLPDECWESVFKFFNEVDGIDICCLKSLSLVSKQFLSITNRIRFSLTICNPTLPFLCDLLKRFTNLTSLNLERFRGDLNKLLCQISCFSLNITSLNLSKQPTLPVNGLRTFSKKITTLTSLTYSNRSSINYNDLVIIADCFPLLKELNLYNLSCIHRPPTFTGVAEPLSLNLFKLRKLSLSCLHNINDQLLFHLFKNCKHLEEAIILRCDRISNVGIASALAQRPTLRSLSLSLSISDYSSPSDSITSYFIDSLVSLKDLTCLDLYHLRISDDLLYSIARKGLPLTRLVLRNCYGYSFAGIYCLLSMCCQSLQHLDLTNVDFLNDQHVVMFSLLLGNLMSISLSKCKMLTKSALFALVKNCASLSEIKMKCIGTKSVENHDSLMDFGVHPQLKSLYFSDNSWLIDESVIMFAHIFSNLQVLDLRNCSRISDEGICQVLRRCSKIRYLNLNLCSRVKLQWLNFKVSKLEVLKLSNTMVDDETLYLISRNCCGLLQLKLKWCKDVTNKGVNHVIENCTQLRKINLRFCRNVHNNVVDSMLYSRASIRKIIAPDCFDLSDKQKERFFRQGCILR